MTTPDLATATTVQLLIALGADAVSLGRPYFLALGAGGEAGVDWLLDFLRSGLERTMALSGCRSLAEVDRDLVTWKRGHSA
jgi:isopentenyl diphosphate isomerase/L-lactate dehydrogenase-like FMN-dependent dehydrogenase